MPQIIIKERQDRSGPVKLTLGPDKRDLPREKQIEVSAAELEVLKNSHEANYVFVIPEPPEVANGGADRAERPEPDSGGHEASPWKGRKLG